MKNQTEKKWWVIHVEAHSHISEYTYGPGYYTKVAFGNFFASEKWGFELMYRKFIEDFFYQQHEEEISYDSGLVARTSFEEKERSVLSCFTRWNGTAWVKSEIKTQICDTKFIVSTMTPRGTGTSFFIQFQGLNADGTRDRTGELAMRQRFLERLTA